MEILLAGPGTGKTTRVKSEIREYDGNLENVRVISFTNATINDLLSDFKKDDISIGADKCMTLHSYAMKLNITRGPLILDGKEQETLEKLILGKKRKYSDEVTDEDRFFNRVCDMLSVITFDQMISRSIDFMKSNRELAGELIGIVDFLVVDEFQDFNTKEKEFILVLSSFAKRTLILGDDDQSIYAFKKSSPEMIISLYNEAEVLRSEHHNICYRCPSKIVDACKNLIGNNEYRLQKDRHTNPKASQGKVFFETTRNMNLLGEYVGQNIIDIKKRDPKGTIMVIGPNKFLFNGIINSLENLNIEYVDLNKNPIGEQDYCRAWLLRCLFGEERFKVANLWILAYCLTNMNAKARNKLKGFIDRLLKKGISSYEDVLALFIDKNILTEEYKNYLSFVGTVEEFVSANPDFSAFIEFVSGDTTQKEVNELLRKISTNNEFDETKANLMTIRKSKGLGADYVFIIGVNEGIIPNLSNNSLDDLEGYRRLLYVGMTRAKKELHLLALKEISTTKEVFKFDRTKFQYLPFRRMYRMIASTFISELKIDFDN